MCVCIDSFFFCSVCVCVCLWLHLKIPTPAPHPSLFLSLTHTHTLHKSLLPPSLPWRLFQSARLIKWARSAAEHYFYQKAIFRRCPQVSGSLRLRQWSHDKEFPPAINLCPAPGECPGAPAAPHCTATKELCSHSRSLDSYQNQFIWPQAIQTTHGWSPPYTMLYLLCSSSSICTIWGWGCATGSEAVVGE